MTHWLWYIYTSSAAGQFEDARAESDYTMQIMPVIVLQNNADQKVQMLASASTKKWREPAVAALDCALRRR